MSTMPRVTAEHNSQDVRTLAQRTRPPEVRLEVNFDLGDASRALLKLEAAVQDVKDQIAAAS